MKTNVFFIIFAVLVFSGCSDGVNNENQVVETGPFEGAWTTFTYYFKDGIWPGEYNITGRTPKVFQEYYNGNNFISKYSESSNDFVNNRKGTFTYTDSTITYTYSHIWIQSEGKWQVFTEYLAETKAYFMEIVNETHFEI